MTPLVSIQSRVRFPFILACALTVMLFLAFPSLLEAAESVNVADSSPSPLFAGWFSKYFSGLATRSRVVQICVVTMCVALFILMKKFSSDRG